MFRSTTYWTSGPDDRIVTRQFSITTVQHIVRHTQWRTHLLANIVHEFPILHVVHQVQQSFDCCENHSRIRVSELNDDALCHDFGICMFLWNIAKQSIQDIDLTPPEVLSAGEYSSCVQIQHLL